MTRCSIFLSLLSLMTVFPPGSVADTPSSGTPTSASKNRLSESSIIGHWVCEKGDWCPDEEFAFEKDAGQNVYNSWLHARPSASGGSWTLEHDTLSVTAASGNFRSRVMKLDDNRLVLEESDSGKQVTIRKIR